LQANVTNAFLAFSKALNLTYDSLADFQQRADTYQTLLLRVAQLNAGTDTYYVSSHVVASSS